ncbi:hypothetical protein ACOMHN_060638 [Nucella lapillus]
MCQVCAKPCQVVKKEESGTSVKLSSDCQCGNTFTWLSQPYSRQLPLVNLVLAAAAFFTACSPTRLLDVFRYSNIACFSMRTYTDFEGSYCPCQEWFAKSNAPNCNRPHAYMS